jgi:hypothetical protein
MVQFNPDRIPLRHVNLGTICGDWVFAPVPESLLAGTPWHTDEPLAPTRDHALLAEYLVRLGRSGEDGKPPRVFVRGEIRIGGETLLVLIGWHRAIPCRTEPAAGAVAR